MRGIVLAILAASIAAVAHAQDATEASKKLIDQQQANNVFEPLPNANARLVRHKQSGMMCLFINGADAQLEIFARPSEARGQDVGCVQKQSNGAELAMYAARLPRGAKVSDALASMVRSMNKWDGWASPPRVDSHPELSDAKPSAWPRDQAAFRGDLTGRPTFVRLAASTTPDGWLVTQRLIVPLDAKGGDPERIKAESHMMAEVIFSETLRVMADQRRR